MSQKGLRSFLGLANYYKKFIRNFSKIAGPLSYLLTKEGKVSHWTDACNAAFNELKRLLSTADVLKYSGFDKSFEVHTDASDFAIGGCSYRMGTPLLMKARN